MFDSDPSLSIKQCGCNILQWKLLMFEADMTTVSSNGRVFEAGSYKWGNVCWVKKSKVQAVGVLASTESECHLKYIGKHCSYAWTNYLHTAYKWHRFSPVVPIDLKDVQQWHLEALFNYVCSIMIYVTMYKTISPSNVPAFIKMQNLGHRYCWFLTILED